MKSSSSTASYALRMSSTANTWFSILRGNSTGSGSLLGRSQSLNRPPPPAAAAACRKYNQMLLTIAVCMGDCSGCRAEKAVSGWCGACCMLLLDKNGLHAWGLISCMASAAAVDSTMSRRMRGAPHTVWGGGTANASAIVLKADFVLDCRCLGVPWQRLFPQVCGLQASSLRGKGVAHFMSQMI